MPGVQVTTLSLDEDPQQRVCGRHRLAEVVVVVDWQQVAVDVSVADQHLHVGDAVNVHDELVELLKLSGFDPVHREAPELCTILETKEDQKKDKRKTLEGRLSWQLNRKRKLVVFLTLWNISKPVG